VGQIFHYPIVNYHLTPFALIIVLNPSPRFTKDHIHPIKTLAILLVIQKFPSHYFFTSTSVVYAIGPSVNTLKAQLIFLPNPIFAICLNFQQQNPFRNQYLMHFSFEKCEINSNRYVAKGFPTTPKTPPNSNTLFSFDFISFSLRKWFNNQ
jgi:hypothetical protein